MTATPKLHRVSIRTIITLLLIVVLSSSVAAGGFSIDGYLKNYSSVYEFPNFRLMDYQIDPPPLGSVNNRLRLNSRWRITSWLSSNVAYDLEARTQDRTLFSTEAISGSVGRTYRIDDLKRRFYPDDDQISSFGLYQNLDRALLAFRVKQLNLYVGRQAISWGSSKIVNPTDILAPFSYSTLDTEDRYGVDAIRARLALGMLSELDLGVVAGQDFKGRNSAAYVRYKTYLARTDIAAMVIGFRENLMVGLDITRSIGSAGGWLEVANVWPKLLQPDSNIRPDNYWRATIGADYNLGTNTYGFIEYHYNQPGESDPANYSSLINSAAYTDGAVYLMGEHYLTPGITHQLTPLVTTSAEALWNLSDLSTYIALSVEYNLAENVYLSGGGYLGFGSGPENEFRLESEFGSYPDTFYGSFRYYF